MRRRKLGVRPIGYKDHRGYEYALADLDALTPDPENPRIPIQGSTVDTMIALLKKDADGLFNLAKDLVNLQGSNPAELLNVSPADDTLVVKEGNRRVAAQKILRNPELLRGHVSDAEYGRWKKLAKNEGVKKLPTSLLVVIGQNHDEWVARRHLGPQGGVGVADWDPQAKARHGARRRGVKDRALELLDSLKANYPDRFGPLEPPPRTFTTLTRVLDSPDARAQLGVDTEADGKVRLTRGERSLRLIEEILRDLQRTDSEKLTSRRIPNTETIKDYLAGVEDRLDDDVDEEPLTLTAPASGAASPPSPSGATAKVPPSRKRAPDILRSFVQPAAPRLRQILEELVKVKRDGAPNAAMVLTRVLLELSIDAYATKHGLPFAGDRNGALEAEIKSFQKDLSIAKVNLPKAIGGALRSSVTNAPRLTEKLNAVVKHLMAANKMNSKDGDAKLRELKANDVVPLLNDAIHRLQSFPTIERVDHIHHVVEPIFNAMMA